MQKEILFSVYTEQNIVTGRHLYTKTKIKDPNYANSI